MALYSSKNYEVKLDVAEISDGIYEVSYTPPQPGDYNVFVHYGGTEIQQSPIRVQVLPTVDVSKVKVVGLEQSEYSFVYFDNKIKSYYFYLFFTPV